MYPGLTLPVNPVLGNVLRSSDDFWVIAYLFHAMCIDLAVPRL